MGAFATPFFAIVIMKVNLFLSSWVSEYCMKVFIEIETISTCKITGYSIA